MLMWCWKKILNWAQSINHLIYSRSHIVQGVIFTISELGEKDEVTCTKTLVTLPKVQNWLLIPLIMNFHNFLQKLVTFLNYLYAFRTHEILVGHCKRVVSYYVWCVKIWISIMDGALLKEIFLNLCQFFSYHRQYTGFQAVFAPAHHISRISWFVVTSCSRLVKHAAWPHVISPVK